MNRKFLVRKDVFDPRDHLAVRSLSPLPTSVDLSANLGPVRDQGDSGSCTGQAGAGFMDWLYNVMQQYFPQKVTPVEFSALFLYARERIANNDFPADEGSDSRTLMWVLASQGICPNTVDPFSDTAIAQMPTSEMGSAAIPFKIGAYHRVLYDDGLATSRSVLASGYCHVIGIPVYAGIQSEETATTGLLSIPAANDTPIGGHEMLAYGYDDQAQMLLIRNSWAASWGIKGNLKIPYGYFAAVGGNDTCDAWVGHMGKPWVPKSA